MIDMSCLQRSFCFPVSCRCIMCTHELTSPCQCLPVETQGLIVSVVQSSVSITTSFRILSQKQCPAHCFRRFNIFHQRFFWQYIYIEDSHRRIFVCVFLNETSASNCCCNMARCWFHLAGIVSGVLPMLTLYQYFAAIWQQISIIFFWKCWEYLCAGDSDSNECNECLPLISLEHIWKIWNYREYWSTLTVFVRLCTWQWREHLSMSNRNLFSARGDEPVKDQ